MEVWFSNVGMEDDAAGVVENIDRLELVSRNGDLSGCGVRIDANSEIGVDIINTLIRYGEDEDDSGITTKDSVVVVNVLTTFRICVAVPCIGAGRSLYDGIDCTIMDGEVEIGNRIAAEGIG